MNGRDVYISCTPADAGKAKNIAEFLEGDGVSCGIAPDGLSDAKVMVLLFTEAVNESEEVMSDVSAAIEKGMTMIPYRLTSSEPKGRLGFYIKPLHWLEAYGMDENEALSALAGLCRTALSPDEEGGREGPEMARLRKKTARRRRMFIIAAAVIAALAAVIILLPKGGGGEGAPAGPDVRKMTNKEVALLFGETLESKYGISGYRLYQSDDENAKYEIHELRDYGTEDEKEYNAAVMLFFGRNDTSDTSTATPDSEFYKVGITNMTDNEIYTTQEEWRPYICCLISILYPDYSEDRVNGLCDELYGGLKDGSCRVIRGDYTFDYRCEEPMYLLEVRTN